MNKVVYIVSLVLAICWLAMGCSYSAFEEVEGDDVVVAEDAVQVPVSFATVIEVPTATRAAVTTLDVLMDQTVGFGVNAVYTDGLWDDAVDINPTFMYDQRVLWDGSRWSYDPIKYWPNKAGERVSFFAWAPYGAAGITICDTTAANSDPSRLHFSLAERSDETTDFVAASAVDNSESNPDYTVRFVFRHELTRMEMFAKVDEDLYREDGDANKTRVIVKSAKFVGAKLFTEADYLFNTDPDGTGGTWSFDGQQAAEYPIRMCGESITIDTREPYVAEHAIVLTQRNVEYQMLVPSDSTTGERYVHLIPPAGADGAADGDVAVEFEYDILTEDPKLMKGYSCVSATKVISLPKGTLKPGYTYIFKFTFCLDRIELDTSVAYEE